ncbi:MAG TPA: hypothetical protein PLD20_30480 [Blastocatellia bacterium]|nr:hypothetical protein [Blastocatellia bacterium]HMX29050.1 hypothetical protein [Blastocatellia bacterium]HMZ22298.1 hypothetical protein [Blastocatellia bacterium]HNG31783.1 hypothetical protein [Blastocatellia bacterium]
MKKLLKKIIAAPFVLAAAMFVLLEDWLWEDLRRLAAAIGRLPVFRQLEALILSLPPYASLAVFAAPSLLLIPVKLAALWFIAHGQAWLGVATAIGAKVAGTAMVARIYQLTEPKLLRIGWFAGLHERFVTFKARVYQTLHATRFYQIIHRQSRKLREAFRRFRERRRSVWRRRWDAAVKLMRRSQ